MTVRAAAAEAARAGAPRVETRGSNPGHGISKVRPTRGRTSAAGLELDAADRRGHSLPLARSFAFAVAVAIALVLTGPVHAQDAGTLRAGVSSPAATVDAGAPEPELPPAHIPRTSVVLEPRDTIRTGDVVRVVISVDAVAGDDVTIPTQTFGSLELHRRTATERTANGRTAHRFVLELLALAPGDVALAPIELRVLTEDGLVGTVRTSALAVHVHSVLGNEPDARPRPPTNPRSLVVEDERPKWILATLLVMALGAALGWLAKRWWQKRPKPVVPPPPPRPAWEIALDKLESLRKDGPAMIAEGRVGPWIDALSDTVREYLGARYGFDGLECTSDEVVQLLASTRIPSLASSEIEIFLSECDLVKFAQASMTESQADGMFKHAHRIVRATSPSFEAAPPMGGLS